jgi:phosphoribosylformylglycinamidine cyclo-ligase
VSEAYRRAGVDVRTGAKAVELIRELAAGAARPELAEGVGGFAGLFRIGEGRYLAAATDGVGTKLEIARATGRLDTVGIDLVAMCADDVVCTGAEPLFFLDYLAVGRVEPERVRSIVAGVAEGCRRAGCALLGGETAEHPGVMAEDAFDLAGFCVGVVDEDALLRPHRVVEGDAIVGLASSGLHANGYTLVRRALLDDAGFGLDDVLPRIGRSLGDELLEPTVIYAPLVRSLGRDGLVHAAAHVTGGGLKENLDRVLPQGLAAEIDWGTWPVPAVIEVIGELPGITEQDLRATFNLGVGMALVVPPERADDVVVAAEAMGSRAFPIGAVVSSPRDASPPHGANPAAD